MSASSPNERDRAKYEQRVGTVVDGRWRIDSLLGWGSTSAVYAATHRNGMRAALKILHKKLCSERAVCERFLREAGIANAVKHRAIVPIRDDGIADDGCAYLVLDLLEGETLEERRMGAGGRLDVEVLAPIVEELGSVLSAVHAAGIVHRDLKPQNVFLLADGGIKLLDFGTARVLERGSEQHTSVQGLVIGTPSFMAPEQAKGLREAIDARTDVWALGATVFTAMTGEFVHVARDAHARLLVAATKPARSITTVLPDLDARVAEVIDKALAFERDDRWLDARSMRVALRKAVLASVPTLGELRAFSDTREEAERDSAIVAIAEAKAASQRPPKKGSSKPPPLAVDLAPMPEEAARASLTGIDTGAGVTATGARATVTPSGTWTLGVVAALGLAVIAALGLYAARNDAPPAAAAATSAAEPSVPPPSPTIDLAAQTPRVTIEDDGLDNVKAERAEERPPADRRHRRHRTEAEAGAAVEASSPVTTEAAETPPDPEAPAPKPPSDNTLP